MKMTNSMDIMEQWMRSCLGCVSGRREFSRGRYFICEIHTSLDALRLFEEFIEELKIGKSIACLMVSPSPKSLTTTVKDEIFRLANLMELLSKKSPEELINGGNLNNKFLLKCPVTGEMTIFDDFDAVAFCPESGNKSDPLYDPLMAAPISAINISSDIYALSVFAQDLSRQHYGRDVAELSASERSEFFERVVSYWQKVAVKTIENYIDITDVELCPTHLSNDKKHWFANHQDPAFAECKKELYSHEMPVVYAPRIIDEWRNFFDNGKAPIYSNMASAGSFSQ